MGERYCEIRKIILRVDFMPTLWNAIEEQDIRRLNMLLPWCTHINYHKYEIDIEMKTARKRERLTPIQFACSRGYTKVVEQLLNKNLTNAKIDVNRIRVKNEPILIAFERG